MLNKCMIIGNLGADPEMRYTANGAPVTTFSVATSRQYTRSSDGERIEETEWFVSEWSVIILFVKAVLSGAKTKLLPCLTELEEIHFDISDAIFTTYNLDNLARHLFQYSLGRKYFQQKEKE